MPTRPFRTPQFQMIDYIVRITAREKRMHTRTASLCAAALVVLSPAALADPVSLTLDGTWFDFIVGDVGDTWRSALDGEAIVFSVSSSTSFTLRLTDFGFAGDQLEVVADGTALLGSTSLVATDDTVYAFSPDEAFGTPGTWSQGVWSLGPGSYTFSGTAIGSPFGGAAWGISAVADAGTNVPEPGSMAVVLLGLTMLATTRARRLR
jgi:hypothetical protein